MEPHSPPLAVVMPKISSSTFSNQFVRIAGKPDVLQNAMDPVSSDTAAGRDGGAANYVSQQETVAPWYTMRWATITPSAQTSQSSNLVMELPLQAAPPLLSHNSKTLAAKKTAHGSDSSLASLWFEDGDNNAASLAGLPQLWDGIAAMVGLGLLVHAFAKKPLRKPLNAFTECGAGS
jgi:hypothetical protein